MTTPESVQFEAIRALDRNPAQTQRELATTLHISVGKANHCLKSLVETGLVKMQSYRTSQNRSAYLYKLTAKGTTAKKRLTKRILAQKLVEYDQLREEIAALKRDL